MEPLGGAEACTEPIAEIVAAGGDRHSQIGIARPSALLLLAELVVRPPGTAWQSPDELRVLAWIACAQRETMPRDYPCSRLRSAWTRWPRCVLI